MQKRFNYCFENSLFEFVEYDVNKNLYLDASLNIDYILHLASNTHPMQYSTDPIGTITTNIIGVQNLLDFAVEHNTTRFAFASSNEIYGENRGDVEKFDENIVVILIAIQCEQDIRKVKDVGKLYVRHIKHKRD